MSNTVSHKRPYPSDTNLATSYQTAPYQHDTQTTFVGSQQPYQSNVNRPQASQTVDLDGDRIMSLPLKSTEDEEVNALLQELKQMETRGGQLKQRAASADNGYKELWHWKELEPANSLEKYKESAEARFEDSGVEIRTLQGMIEHQEKYIDQSSSRLERVYAETQELKTNPPKQTQHQRLERQIAKYKEQMEKDEEVVQELHVKIGKLQEAAALIRQYQEPTPQEEETIADLRRKLELYELMSKMSILEHKVKGLLDIFTCAQSGRRGRLCYKLTFFRDDDGQEIVRYKPLLDQSTDILPDYMKGVLEFAVDNINMFFWRTTTLLNKETR